MAGGDAELLTMCVVVPSIRGIGKVGGMAVHEAFLLRLERRGLAGKVQQPLATLSAAPAARRGSPDRLLGAAVANTPTPDAAAETSSIQKLRSCRTHDELSEC